MRTKNVMCAALGAVLIAGGLTACVSESQQEAKLQAQAKVSREDAEKTALAKVPGGTVKEGELEKEHGKVVWSFDIATLGSKDITEIQVDAVSGQIVAMGTESASSEAAEKQKDKD